MRVENAGALLVELKGSKGEAKPASAKRGGGPIFTFQAHGRGPWPRLLETGADVLFFATPAGSEWVFAAVPLWDHFSGFNAAVYRRLAGQFSRSGPAAKLRHTSAEVEALYDTEWRIPAQLAPLVRVWAQEKREHEQRARSRSRSR